MNRENTEGFNGSETIQNGTVMLDTVIVLLPKRTEYDTIPRVNPDIKCKL